LEENIKSLTDSIQLRKESSLKLEQELAEAKHRIEALQAEVEGYKEESDHYAALDEENTHVRQESLLLQDDLEIHKQELNRIL
jgi:hypothetical protein